ncbi:unnamed protein product [Caenorhabditis brenneri]
MIPRKRSCFLFSLAPPTHVDPTTPRMNGQASGKQYSLNMTSREHPLSPGNGDYGEMIDDLYENSESDHHMINHGYRPSNRQASRNCKRRTKKSQNHGLARHLRNRVRRAQDQLPQRRDQRIRLHPLRRNDLLQLLQQFRSVSLEAPTARNQAPVRQRPALPRHLRRRVRRTTDVIQPRPARRSSHAPAPPPPLGQRPPRRDAGLLSWFLYFMIRACQMQPDLFDVYRDVEDIDDVETPGAIYYNIRRELSEVYGIHTPGMEN